MKTEKRRFRLEEFELEEKYLTKKHNNGFELESIKNGKYVFNECEKNNYIYKSDFNEEDINELDYINSIEDLGWEYVCRYRDNYYFRRINDGKGDYSKFLTNKQKFDIYKSRIKRHIFEFIPIYIITIVTASILCYKLIDESAISFLVAIILDILITISWCIIALNGVFTMAKMDVLIEND